MSMLSASIMAHPMREPLVAELVHLLGPVNIPIAWDTVATPSREPEQRWATGRQGWSLHDPGADWHVVIQDDAMPAPNLLPGLARALDHVPDDVHLVSPYLGTRRPAQIAWTTTAQRARQARASWVQSRTLGWGVAIAVRTAVIPDMLRGADRLTGIPYDSRIGRTMAAMGSMCWYTWPSLVDHRESPSLIARGDEGRHAHEFAPGSALDVDWSGPVVDDGKLQKERVRALRSRPSGMIDVVRPQ